MDRVEAIERFELIIWFIVLSVLTYITWQLIVYDADESKPCHEYATKCEAQFLFCTKGCYYYYKQVDCGSSEVYREKEVCIRRKK
jgi:hypothetical protein